MMFRTCLAARLPGIALVVALAGITGPALGRELAIGLLSLASDARYTAQAVEKGLANMPSGRSEAAVQLALDDSAFNLNAAGWTAGKLVAVEAADLTGLRAALEGMQKQGIRHVVLELPAPAVIAVTDAMRGKDVLLVNAAAPEDALRAAHCAPNLFHALPSVAMQTDAIAQALAVRKWNKPLLLVGPTDADQLLLAAYTRSFKKFGIKPVAQRPFKLSNDPRERDLGNPRLLTGGADYDGLVVLDAQGEFARDLPYRSLLPRPVFGSSGLTAQAWSPWYERQGAPQLTRRFLKRTGRPMGSYDWATWVAARTLIEAAIANPKASAAEQGKALKTGTIGVDGYKGQRLTYRAWDGQLRQPVLLTHGNGLADIAPLDGFLHPKTALDTLGFDVAESGCKTP